LDESQRALVADKLATLPRGTNQHVEISTSSTQVEAANLLRVGRHNVIKGSLHESWRRVRYRGRNTNLRRR
jgi:hypothetical protein